MNNTIHALKEFTGEYRKTAILLTMSSLDCCIPGEQQSVHTQTHPETLLWGAFAQV